LRERIQEAANEHKLGARIVFVGLQDIHPPMKVAGDYEKVVSASHQRQAKILAAQADSIHTNSVSEALSTNMINQAIADRVTREISAQAQAALFTNQIPAFNAAPSVYMDQAYLQMFARATGGRRKYVILTTNTHNVFVIDLQDKIREDLLNLEPGLKK
jgi:regulator of protease activity HflC (stomatin/prohibitin superfamily)